jgi:ABC-type glycerol-3-phosphate transport system permease component
MTSPASPARFNSPKFWAALRTHTILILVALSSIGPVLFVVLASFRPITSFDSLANLSAPLTLVNYIDAFSDSVSAQWLLNSIIVTCAVTVLTVIVDMLAGYAFAKLKFRGSALLLSAMISTVMIPFAVTLLPNYVLVAKLGLVNTYAGLIIPLLSAPIGVYLMRQFISEIPDALLEAAKIDGANPLQIFLGIIVPLSRQPAIVLAVFTFVNTWNSFLWPLLIAQSEDKRTLIVGIATQSLQHMQNFGAMTAQTVISMVPTLLVFAIFQRYFLMGLTAGSVKA